MDALLAERPQIWDIGSNEGVTHRTALLPPVANDNDVDATDLAALIGEIYDAALAPTRWTSTLANVRSFVGGLSATIFGKSVSGHGGGVFYDDGRVPQEASHLYFSKYAPIDPSNTLQVFTDVDDAIITSRMLDLEDFADTRFAREWSLPNGIVDMVLAPIERRGSWAAMFGVFRHERDGVGDERMQRRVSLLTPHIRRAVSIGQVLGQAGAEAAIFSDTLDGLAAGVFFIDDDGRLVHANAAGRRMLGENGVVSASKEGTIRLERTNLRKLLPSNGAPATEAEPLLIESTDGERYVAHVLPLGDGARRIAGVAYDAVAAVFVQPATFEPQSIPQSVAKTFDLTPSELRVVLSTIRNGGVAEIAEDLGIGEATVRTHLHRIFAKTETKRQADLVKLVAGFASPLNR